MCVCGSKKDIGKCEQHTHNTHMEKERKREKEREEKSEYCTTKYVRQEKEEEGVNVQR